MSITPRRQVATGHKYISLILRILADGREVPSAYRVRVTGQTAISISCGNNPDAALAEALQHRDAMPPVRMPLGRPPTAKQEKPAMPRRTVPTTPNRELSPYSASGDFTTVIAESFARTQLRAELAAMTESARAARIAYVRRLLLDERRKKRAQPSALWRLADVYGIDTDTLE